MIYLRLLAQIKEGEVRFCLSIGAAIEVHHAPTPLPIRSTLCVSVFKTPLARGDKVLEPKSDPC